MVVDDCPEGSAKSTVEQVRDPRISYLRNPNPTGGIPSLVRNLAWPRARGRFVHLLGGGDTVSPHHYGSVTAAFASCPDVGLVFGRVEPFGEVTQAQLKHERQFFARAARSAAICEHF